MNSPLAYSAVFGGGLTVLGASDVPGAPGALDTWVFLVNPPGNYGAGVVPMDGSAATFQLLLRGRLEYVPVVWNGYGHGRGQRLLLLLD